jgi:protein translocase SecG subunit
MSITAILKVLMVIVAFFLIISILMQRSKGKGFNGAFDINKYMSVQKGINFIERTTWVLVVLLIVLGASIGFISK